MSISCSDSDLARYAAALRDMLSCEPGGVIPILDPAVDCAEPCTFKKGARWYCPTCHAISPDRQAKLDALPAPVRPGGPTRFEASPIRGGRS